MTLTCFLYFGCVTLFRIFKNKGKFPQDLCPKLWTWKILPLHVDGQGNRVVVGTRGCLSLLTINILQFFELKIDILEKTLCHSKQTDHLKWITWSMSTTVMIGFHCQTWSKKTARHSILCTVSVKILSTAAQVYKQVVQQIHNRSK